MLDHGADPPRFLRIVAGDDAEAANGPLSAPVVSVEQLDPEPVGHQPWSTAIPDPTFRREMAR